MVRPRVDSIDPCRDRAGLRAEDAFRPMCAARPRAGRAGSASPGPPPRAAPPARDRRDPKATGRAWPRSARRSAARHRPRSPSSPPTDPPFNRRSRSRRASSRRRAAGSTARRSPSVCTRRSGSRCCSRRSDCPSHCRPRGPEIDREGRGERRRSTRSSLSDISIICSRGYPRRLRQRKSPRCCRRTSKPTTLRRVEGGWGSPSAYDASEMGSKILERLEYPTFVVG